MPDLETRRRITVDLTGPDFCVLRYEYATGQRAVRLPLTQEEARRVIQVLRAALGAQQKDGAHA